MPEHNTAINDSEVEVFSVPQRLFDESKHPKPFISSFNQYQEMYERSNNKPHEFWGDLGRELLDWQTPFKTVQSGSFEHSDIAIIYEADEPGHGREITYSELLREVCKAANVLKKMGVRKGDTVAVYMSMIPEIVIALLAIVRIGAVHSVIFAGFSSESLRDRILDADSRVVITTDEGRRGGKTIGTKHIVDDALKQCPHVKHVLVFRRTGNQVHMQKGRDYWWHEELPKYPPICPPERMKSEDPLFLLYTSGSTGKPKGLMHTTGGYLVGAAASTKYVFDVHSTDKIGTAGDIGWITGHTYILYGPLLLGTATLVFEGTPAYPSFSRYWEIVEKHKLTHWYVAPTAIRLLKRAGDTHFKHDITSLRIIGSVGEPIAPDIWKWYYGKVGNSQCQIVDTYWQTESGSHTITPFACATPTKPGSATLPFFGIQPVILDPENGKELTDPNVEGVLAFKKPWPSMARTIWGAHERYFDTYMKPYPGYYFTGDGASRDYDGYYWIKGRVDDVVNISGHRLSTAEIEAALTNYPGIAEAACCGIPDELTGQAVVAFVSLKSGIDASENLNKELTLQVRKAIGPFAAPKKIYLSISLHVERR
ncbi:Acetyl-coenzyme A synthetase [Neolecta irregularis DAH-3]|uniref:Acetyl-coenzyme A synthetase n=1 Tax=Neolecta irregularis (strain DAH-3) TaxID=1198029 RepID=A0A1U7LGM9_NEOID|nr:Acetyl-coenzyme A synthetase [Neolecta irregularis DAH-3]|eukprot:OLL21702.1 Acetyl-coenzyme A synthetase [Neolecta irregularis DAH-3]